ncbi:MAG: preprotein translocase subunit YajC [Spirochaetaceae bacterium]|jgi:preprotein translocase subunit YajC|nr:preprotein translocase subunit YajC [Spirochaetaceae bacterium]
MNQLVFSLLMAGPGGGSGTTQQNLLSMLPIVLIIAIFYLFIIRPQNKKQKETQRMLADLKKGDRIVTIGGIHGVIQTVRDGSIILKVDENCKIEFSRNAVASVESQGKGENSPEASTEEK